MKPSPGMISRKFGERIVQAGLTYPVVDEIRLFRVTLSARTYCRYDAGLACFRSQSL